MEKVMILYKKKQNLEYILKMYFGCNSMTSVQFHWKLFKVN